MTSATKRRPAKKALRIRDELLPGSAKYATIDDVEYVMIPVADFGDWYEDVEDGAVVRHSLDNPAPLIPAMEVKAKVQRQQRNAKK